jgi:hypothetical protein
MIIKTLSENILLINDYHAKSNNEVLKRAAFYAYIDITQNNEKISDEQYNLALDYLELYIACPNALQELQDQNDLVSELLFNNSEMKISIDSYNTSMHLVDHSFAVATTIKTAYLYLQTYHHQTDPDTYNDLGFILYKEQVDFSFKDIFEEEVYMSANFKEDFEDVSGMFEDDEDEQATQINADFKNTEEYQVQLDASNSVFIELYEINDNGGLDSFEYAFDNAQSMLGSNCSLFSQNELEDFLKAYSQLQKLDEQIAKYAVNIDCGDFDSFDELCEATRLVNFFIQSHKYLVEKHLKLIRHMPLSEVSTYKFELAIEQDIPNFEN